MVILVNILKNLWFLFCMLTIGVVIERELRKIEKEKETKQYDKIKTNHFRRSTRIR